jgi:hypothetical protein
VLEGSNLELKQTRRKVWIGLVEVRPWPGNNTFEGSPGAFSNALCLARNSVEYQQIVQEEMAKMALDVVRFQDVEPFDESKHAGDDEIIKLAERLAEDSPFDYDTFYIFESDES